MRTKLLGLSFFTTVVGGVHTAVAQGKAAAALNEPVNVVSAGTKDSSVKQRQEEMKTTFTVGLDMRTRSEVRHGYKSIPTVDTPAAVSVNQRTRLNIDFKSRKFDFWASVQDTRVWGQQDPKEGQGTSTPTTATTYPLYMFEVYAEPHITDKFSIRIGRQRIEYDNQRLFAENDWRLTANAHDAIRFIYNNRLNLSTELVIAFNQYAENTFSTDYKPVGFTNYKSLIVHYLNWKLNDRYTLTTINAADGYQATAGSKTTFMRYTSGGRIEYASYNWYLTASAYYQYGKDSSGEKLSAYYFQPEIRYSGVKNLIVRAGLEYLSGQDTLSRKDNNFSTLYGTAHRFMGNMDLFGTFPKDVNNGGLINPYLFFQYKMKKLNIRCENHLFYAQSNAAFRGKGVMSNYLGFENDWRLNYKPLSYIDIESGFCWASVTSSMVVVKKTGDTQSFPYFFYISARFTPSLLKLSF